MSEKKEQIIAGICDQLSEEEMNILVVKHLKTLSKWDLKRVLCSVLDVDYMDDRGLAKEFQTLVSTVR